MHKFPTVFRVILIVCAVLTLLAALSNFLIGAVAGTSNEISNLLKQANVETPSWVYFLIGGLGLLMGINLLLLALKEKKISVILMWVLSIAVFFINLLVAKVGIFSSVAGLVLPIAITIVIFAKKYWAEMD